jgi:hypothetical protein
MSDVSSLNRTGASEFIVPYCKFLKSLNCPLSIGMRFKVGCKNEDANQRSTLLTLEIILHVQQSLELSSMFVGLVD